MTLRTIQTDFTEQLLHDSKEELLFDLRMDGPLFSKDHPKVIWARLQQKYTPETFTSTSLQIPGWSYDCFLNVQEAQAKYPGITVKINGKPSDIFKFIKAGYEDAIVDFQPVGAIVLSRKMLHIEFKNMVHWHELPIWFNYALSPELWGPQGKWIRFHERLRKLFIEHNLLKTSDTPGLYVLEESAKIIERHGFQGTILDGCYTLSLPWTFPLSGLNKLEKVIQQEF